MVFVVARKWDTGNEMSEEGADFDSQKLQSCQKVPGVSQ